MGFGFNLLFFFVLLPITFILAIIWLISRQSMIGKTIGIVWVAVLSFVIISLICQKIMAKKALTKSDFYGNYVIDRSHYPGRQADWQYAHYRFEITRNDSILFYETDGNKVLKTYKGSIITIESYRSNRLAVKMQQPAIHILASNPTIYRSIWSFYLVFNSLKFKNVFFKKGNWKKI